MTQFEESRLSENFSCDVPTMSHPDLKFVATVTTGVRVKKIQLCKVFQKTTQDFLPNFRRIMKFTQSFGMF